MSDGANSARRCCRRMFGKPSASVLTSAVMTGGTAIRANFRVNGSPALSVRSAGGGSHRTKTQNTVPEHVFTHRGDHNHQRQKAAFFIGKTMVEHIQCTNAGFFLHLTMGSKLIFNIQTQEAISKRKGIFSGLKPQYPSARLLALDYCLHFNCKKLFLTWVYRQCPNGTNGRTPIGQALS